MITTIRLLALYSVFTKQCLAFSPFNTLSKLHLNTHVKDSRTCSGSVQTQCPDFQHLVARRRRLPLMTATESNATVNIDTKQDPATKRIVIIGAGFGGLSAAHALAKSAREGENLDISLIDASPKVGGLVRDGFTTTSGKRPAEAGQHGFWNNYHNIFKLLRDDLKEVLDIDDVLTGYAEQGQYSPEGLEAIWPVYKNKTPSLPTGLAQALYTKFTKLPVLDRVSAAPLVLAFSEFDDSPEAWAKYDSISFRALCTRLGVSKRCYEEAFEPMILTGLFAPGAECSAAAALGMAYFFVLKSQNSFDVRWCRGNIGEKIFDPWVKHLEANGVNICTSTRVVGFDSKDGKEISNIICQNEKGDEVNFEADTVVFAVGAAALNAIVRNSPLLSKYSEFRRYANLRGTSVLATRIFLDRVIDTPYSANACFGFDKGVGMTVFDITKLHKSTSGKARTIDDAPGSVIEVDFYHSNSLNVMDDGALVDKVKKDLDTIFGSSCSQAKVADAAIIRLPQAVNWYYPGSYADMPDHRSVAIPNAFFVGDLVRSRHGSWSQEKAFVTGIETTNLILDKPIDNDIISLSPDEPHVAAGRSAVSLLQTVLGTGDSSRAPSLVDFLW